MDKSWYRTYFGTEAKEIVVYRDVLDRIYIVADNPPVLHNCDQMGCASMGPHIFAVYLNANKYEKLRDENNEIRNQWHIDLNDRTKLQAENERLKELLKLAYRNWLEDPDVAWAELGEKLCDGLCESMGDKDYQEWMQALKGE